MTYNDMRHFADSYGLIFMGIVYVVLVGWAFTRGARAGQERAAMMIFDTDEADSAKERSDG